ncbi:hypothetical protein HZR84_00615 [Hyphobacterium sp. CCMP332]|nr:hypothetical protein HZR84_00615 [Hyphobacterium sp. CCMP332]
MKDTKVYIILIISLAILNVFSIGFIWYGHIKDHKGKHDRHKNEHRMEKILKKNIGLSESQMQDFHEARSRHFEQIKPVERELMTVKKVLFDANVRNAEKEEISPLLRKIGDLHIKIDSLTYEHFKELRSYCNESQIEEFDKMLERMLRKEFGKRAKKKANKRSR